MSMNNEDKRGLFAVTGFLVILLVAAAVFSIITKQWAPIRAVVITYATVGGSIALTNGLHRLARRWWK